MSEVTVVNDSPGKDGENAQLTAVQEIELLRAQLVRIKALHKSLVADIEQALHSNRDILPSANI